jgi:sensor histidine kinase YesM
LLVGDYKVAPLLIQPFVENAIIHGIAPSEREGLYLKITVRLDGDYIHYRIEDNGIGRAASLAYTRQRRTVEHKSLGLAISRERIEILNRLQGSDAVLEIVDLEDTDGQAGGTRVLLTLKIA